MSAILWSCEKITYLNAYLQKIQPFMPHILTRREIVTYTRLPSGEDHGIKQGAVLYRKVTSRTYSYLGKE